MPIEVRHRSDWVELVLPLGFAMAAPFLGVALGVRREAPGCEVGARRHWLRGERDGGYPSLKRAVTRALTTAA